VKPTTLVFPGFIFTAFSTAPSPILSRSFYNVSMSLSFKISLYNIQSCAKSLIVGSKFLQISSTYARNRSGPNTLPCGTSDLTPTFSDKCPPTLTLCEDLKVILLPLRLPSNPMSWPQFSFAADHTELNRKLLQHQLLSRLAWLSLPENHLCPNKM
jgi:hypothetical protein